MFTKAFTLLALAAAAQAHMHLEFPPALKGDNNKFTIKGTADVFYNYPYGCCSPEQKKFAMGPCRGHHKLLNTDEGKPVVTWTAGETVEFRLSGQKIKGDGPQYSNAETNVLGGSHSGGSCQAGFSFDGGATFHTVATWNGGCPHREGGISPETQKFDIKLPDYLPSTERALFAWSWVNREREFFMNCASVEIKGVDGQVPTPPTPSGQPSIKPSPTDQTKASSTRSPVPRPSPTGGVSSKQYTLDGCTCECPTQSFTKACECQCSSTQTKRHIVARKALAIHRRSVRRATGSFEDLPPMQLGFVQGCDLETFPPKSAGFELKFSKPGEINVETDTTYKLQESTCSNVEAFALP
ncbi:hypothetical protein B0J11DRAFT_268293 [Dendryphion nanum]|uniref:Lytic polysaccharide monooxygenase n=1 Tax=Dendryphion nanum TaxID=256645 RepID=A0A9P9IPL1_9PLEO|nr:hypothetical protein B0J11DRAFT_268293 [Dendryphion nanum]